LDDPNPWLYLPGMKRFPTTLAATTDKSTVIRCIYDTKKYKEFIQSYPGPEYQIWELKDKMFLKRRSLLFRLLMDL
jgi:hypothetical protein